MQAAIHELRNHLCVAMAGVEAFLDHKLEPSDARLSAIFAALRAVDALIEDLPRDRIVAFETHVVPMDVCRLVASQVGAMEGFAGKRGIRLTIEACTAPHEDRAAFLGDPVRIAEIVTNVMLNAIQHTPPSGEVRVRFECDAVRARVCISDEGPGIALGERARIFETGYRCATTVSPGSGIGLALVKQFVDTQGGTIIVSDGPLRGTSITIDLPAIAAPAVRRAEAAVAAF